MLLHLVFAPFRGLCIVLLALLWLEVCIVSALWWPLCGNCFVSPCVVGGGSAFVKFDITSWVPLVVSHLDWSSCAVGGSAAALRSHVVPGCGVVTFTSFTWCTGFLCANSSCFSCSMIAVVLGCGVLLLCSANKLLWYC